MAKRLNILSRVKTCNINLQGANGIPLNIRGQVMHRISLSHHQSEYKEYNNTCNVVSSNHDEHQLERYKNTHFHDNGRFHINWIVVDGLATDVLIGTSAFHALGLIINTQDDIITIGKNIIYYGNAIKTNDELTIPPRSSFLIKCWTNTNNLLFIATE